jgi:hypothetical protein
LFTRLTSAAAGQLFRIGSPQSANDEVEDFNYKKIFKSGIVHYPQRARGLGSGLEWLKLA